MGKLYLYIYIISGMLQHDKMNHLKKLSLYSCLKEILLISLHINLYACCLSKATELSLISVCYYGLKVYD